MLAAVPHHPYDPYHRYPPSGHTRMPLWLLIVLAVLACAVIIGSIVWKYRRQRQEERERELFRSSRVERNRRLRPSDGARLRSLRSTSDGDRPPGDRDDSPAAGADPRSRDRRRLRWRR